MFLGILDSRVHTEGFLPSVDTLGTKHAGPSLTTVAVLVSSKLSQAIIPIPTLPSQRQPSNMEPTSTRAQRRPPRKNSLL